jgi:hypothetical protein
MLWSSAWRFERILLIMLGHMHMEPVIHNMVQQDCSAFRVLCWCALCAVFLRRWAQRISLVIFFVNFST